MTPDEALAAYRLNQIVEYESSTPNIVPGRHACTIEAVNYGGSINVRNISKIHHVKLHALGDCALLFLDPKCPPALTATAFGYFYYTTHCSNLYPQKPPVVLWSGAGLTGGGPLGQGPAVVPTAPPDVSSPAKKAASHFPHTCACGSPCYVGGGPQDIDCSNASCRHHMRGKGGGRPQVQVLPRGIVKVT